MLFSDFSINLRDKFQKKFQKVNHFTFTFSQALIYEENPFRYRIKMLDKNPSFAAVQVLLENWGKGL